jgi:mannose-6-phosphate isomerase-like protein (cupin superfamily)
MTVGGEIVSLRPGTAVSIPPGTAHATRKTGDAPVRLVYAHGAI